MKSKKNNCPGTESRPQKVLLHMAKLGGEWAGKATDFSTEENFKFKNLQELFDWLKNKRL
jgi:hypothetical protein